MSSTGAPSAKPRHLLGMACRAFAQAFLPIGAGISGPASFTSRRAKREEQRQSAQDQALRNLHALERRRTALLIEQQILIAEIKHARRTHSPVSSIEAQLRAVVTELLTIG